LRWVAGTLGQIQAVQDEHTQRLGRLETKFEGVEGKVDGLRGKVDGLIQALPTIVGDAVRDAMKPNGRS
jgi:hypothetical protein